MFTIILTLSLFFAALAVINWENTRYNSRVAVRNTLAVAFPPAFLVESVEEECFCVEMGMWGVWCPACDGTGVRLVPTRS